MPRKSFHVLAEHLQKTLEETLPAMVGDRVNEIVKKIVPLYVAKGLLLDKQKTQVDVAAMIDEVMQKERENLRAEITSQVNNVIANTIPLQVDTFLRNYMSNNILHVHPTQLRANDFSIWWSLKIKFEKSAPAAAPCRTAAIHPKDHDDHQDDAHPEGENSAKKQKMFEHRTYSVGESLSEQDMNQDPNLSGSGQRKYILSLCKFPAVPFPDDDMEEQTSRWVNKCIRKFNPYARFSVEHWKNIWIIEVIRTSYELGHEHKFITEIIAKIANGKIDLITEPYYKYLNKNDIEDLYLLFERVHDFQLGMDSYQQKVNLTAPSIAFPGIEKEKLFSITSEPVTGMIYENNKKEKSDDS
ncbi:hypothetical protein Tco_1336211 [Tanacetum coccineum]